MDKSRPDRLLITSDSDIRARIDEEYRRISQVPIGKSETRPTRRPVQVGQSELSPERLETPPSQTALGAVRGILSKGGSALDDGRCEPEISNLQIGPEWPRIAVWKLLRFTTGWWLGILFLAWLGNERLTANSAVWVFVAVLGFIVLIVPLFLALSFPLLNDEMRRAWAQGIMFEWAAWKSQLVETSRIAKDRKSPPALRLQRTEHNGYDDRPSATNRTSVGSQQEIAYAPVWERLKALICDFAVILLTVGMFVLTGEFSQDPAFAGIVLFVVYMVLLQSIFHTTVGKYVMGLELRSTNPKRLFPSIWAVLGRETVGRFVSASLFGIGYWAGVHSPQNRAWSDRISGTVVVRRRTSPVLRGILKVLVIVSLLFSIVLYGTYVYALSRHF